MDNSVCWDAPLSKITPARLGDVARCDLQYGDPADRPTDDDYRRYVYLASEYRDSGYRDSLEHHFAVEDPAFNALFCLSEHALAQIALELGDQVAAAVHATEADRIRSSIVDLLWDEQSCYFFPRDLRTGKLIREYGCTGAVPLILPRLPVAESLLHTLRGPRFLLGEVIGIPSNDLTASSFDRCRYWRGPSWFNIGWLVHSGLLEHGMDTDASKLRDGLLKAAHHSGITEYIDPITGTGHGATEFSWTAALILDLLHGELHDS